ncbi:MAG: hypothetical protein SFY67_03495 [Candidatus Melainabacteria bacterium]|nr:hypothetical protein [Candidatus Melainabacteria bacterium]
MKIKLVLTTLSLGLALCQPSHATDAMPGFKPDDLPPEPKSEVQIPMNRPSLTPVADELAPDIRKDAPDTTKSSTPETSQTSSDLPPEPEVIVRDGPLTDARSELLRSIYRAKENGIGITNYMKAFEYIEDMAAQSQPDEAIQKRIDSLKTSLDEQLKRNEELKIEAANASKSGPGGSRKLGPGNLIADPQAIPSSFRTMGGGAGGQSDQLLDMIIADKLGGKSPSQMSKQELQKKMKEIPELEEYLKRFK